MNATEEKRFYEISEKINIRLNEIEQTCQKNAGFEFSRESSFLSDSRKKL